MGNAGFEYGDIKVICAEDCGNAPRKVLLKELYMSFSRNEIGFIEDHLTEDAIWNIIGDRWTQGKDLFLESLKKLRSLRVTEIQICNIITHGKTAAVNGSVHLEDNSSRAFCDVYLFNNSAKSGKIKEITSYIIVQ